MKNNLLTSIKALFKADQGSTIKIPNMLEDILLLYDVGTEKAKFRQLLNPLQHTTILGPLRFLDLSSATSKARKITNNNNVRSERENETKLEDEEVQSTMNKTTYRIILESIIPILHILIRKSNTLFLDRLIGFQLLESRSERFYFGTPRPNKYLRKKWKQIILLANKTERKKIKKKTPRVISLTTHLPITATTNLPSPSTSNPPSATRTPPSKKKL